MKSANPRSESLIEDLILAYGDACTAIGEHEDEETIRGCPELDRRLTVRRNAYNALVQAIALNETKQHYI